MPQAVDDATAITVVVSEIETASQLPAALEAYETSRKPRVSNIFWASRNMQQNYAKETTAANAAPADAEAELKRSENQLKAIQASWTLDAAGLARTTLSGILGGSRKDQGGLVSA